MRFLIAEVKSGVTKLHAVDSGKESQDNLFVAFEKSIERDKSAKDNFNRWKQEVEGSKWYSLLVIVEHDRSKYDFVPFKTRKDEEAFFDDWRRFLQKSQN